MFNIKPIEIMKKIIIAIIAIISIITLNFNSCGNNAKECRLIEMRDSIQLELEWKYDNINEMLTQLDSLAKNDTDKFIFMHDYYKTEIDMLRQMIDNDDARLFQIELELKK